MLPTAALSCRMALPFPLRDIFLVCAGNLCKNLSYSSFNVRVSFIAIQTKGESDACGVCGLHTGCQWLGRPTVDQGCTILVGGGGGGALDGKGTQKRLQ